MEGLGGKKKQKQVPQGRGNTFSKLSKGLSCNIESFLGLQSASRSCRCCTCQTCSHVNQFLKIHFSLSFVYMCVYVYVYTCKQMHIPSIGSASLENSFIVSIYIDEKDKKKERGKEWKKERRKKGERERDMRQREHLKRISIHFISNGYILYLSCLFLSWI